jgi:hypothetical protein
LIFIGRHIPGGSKLLRNGKQELFLEIIEFIKFRGEGGYHLVLVFGKVKSMETNVLKRIFFAFPGDTDTKEESMRN